MNWSNPVFSVLTNAEIVEYDIKSANTSLMKEYGLLDPEAIRLLEDMPKKQRQVHVGLILREDKELAKKLEDAFNTTISRFIRENKLDQTVDILAIRKDAVFVINKPIRTRKFGPHIEFVRKSTFASFIRIGDKMELFFKPKGSKEPRFELDHFMKEGPDYDRTIAKLEPGMISFIEELLALAESSASRRVIYKYISEFCLLYKTRQLDAEYYREFNRNARFRITNEESSSTFDVIDDSYVDDLDITYNYINVIIPVIRAFI